MARAQVLDTPPSSCSFDELVLPLRTEMHRWALRLAGSSADADDLVQDTLLRALGAWDRFEPGTNLRAWLRRILTNAFLSGCRRRRTRRCFAARGDEAVSLLYGTAAEEQRYPEALFDHDLGDEVRSALAELGPDFRRVVELADLEGRRYKDIAGELGIPVGTVMSRLHRARRALESRLRSYAARDYGIRRVERVGDCTPGETGSRRQLCVSY